LQICVDTISANARFVSMIDKIKLSVVTTLLCGTLNASSLMRAFCPALGRTVNSFAMASHYTFDKAHSAYETFAPMAKPVISTGFKCVEKFACSAERIVTNSKSNPRSFEDFERVSTYGTIVGLLSAAALPYAPLAYDTLVTAGNVAPLVPYASLLLLAATGGITFGYHMYNIMNEENNKALNQAIVSVSEATPTLEQQVDGIEGRAAQREKILDGMKIKKEARATASAKSAAKSSYKICPELLKPGFSAFA